MTTRKLAFIMGILLLLSPFVRGQGSLASVQKGRLLYENTFSSSEAVKGWVMEGPGTIKVKDGWMELYSKGKEYHHVYWCPEDFPSSFVAEWEAQNLDKDGGLIILFFSAKGINGEDIFDASLPKRDGTFAHYTKAPLNCYHTSYYTDNPENTERELAHLRKNKGFNLVFQGPEGIPKNSEAIHHLTLVKDQGHIQLYVDDRKVIDWTDDGKTYGKVLGGGKMGFRQMKWSHFRYRNFRVWELGKERIPAPFHRHQTYPIPSGGMAVDFNPTSLRWPFEKGKNVQYDVRLSQDSTFQKEPVYQQEKTDWAMYNPHQKLGEGTWYWQYRKTGGNWSKLIHFEVKAQARPMVSPPPAALLAAVPRDHPRLLAHGGEIAGLRNRPKNADINAIFVEAEDALKQPLPREDEGIAGNLIDDELKNKQLIKLASLYLGNRVYAQISSLCQAYLLTGDERFAEKALAIGREVAPWDPEKVTRLSDFGDARFMLSLALVYDTFYDRLTPAEKASFRKAVRLRAEDFYNDWKNNIEVRVLSAHVWQHILHYFFQTALIMHGDEPEAATWLSYAYELFLTRSPILGGVDGGWVEGASYFRMNMETLLDIPAFIQKYTGFDFVNAHPWYRKQIDWMVYGMPPGSAADGFGDNNETIQSPGIEYVAFATEIAKLTQYPLAAWYAAQCRKHEAIDLSRKSILRWFRLTKTPDLSLPAFEPKSLPMAQLFKETGVVAMHTNPMQTEKDLMVSMRSSPFGSYGHMTADQNTFNILYGGEKTFYRTGYKVDMNDPHRLGWNKHTKGSNGLLIDGAGQPFSTEAFGMLTRFVQCERLAYAKGDAANAYQSNETKENYGLTKFDRHLVLLKPGIVIIYDELEAAKPVSWSWLIHSMKKINLDSEKNTFVSQFEKSVGQGRLWSSMPVEWAMADTFEIPAVNAIGKVDEDGEEIAYENNQWHLKATSQMKSERMRFLSIVEVGPAGTLQALTHTNGPDGLATIRVGDWQIKAQVGVAGPAELTIMDVGGRTAFTIGGSSVTLQGKTYQGTSPATTKLVEIRGGVPKFEEVSEELPASVKQVLLQK